MKKNGGFYVISKIPLGKYRIRVSQQQMGKLNLSAETEPAFEISADDQFESGVDFTLSQIIQWAGRDKAGKHA